mmetsp:Transcript_66967/g.134995  ORF Transcript_66967/g.134995 Transcript_66967/m.134995 type:complete len:576 (+) Transcript_66967:66-1793(+)
MALAGHLLCFTGTLSFASRAEFTKLAEGAGAKTGTSVTAKTTHLVAGPGAGSKEQAAIAKGVTIWSEADLIAALAGAGGANKAPKKAAPKAAPKAKGKRAAPKAAEEEEEEEKVAPPPKKAAKKAAANPKQTAKGKGKAPAASAAAAEEPAPPSASAGGSGGGVKRVDRMMPNGSAFAVCGDLDVKLMQTNIGGGSNNNKFYILQTLQGQGQFTVLFRWGRLGEPGQSKMETFSTLDAATARFEKQFREKTKNAWGARDSFVKVEGKYQLVEVEDGDGDDGGDAALGKLTRSQVEKGQAVLAQIREQLLSNFTESSAPNVSHLSGLFYSLIPTASGRVAPPPLSSEALLSEKEGLLEFWLRMGFEEVGSAEQVGSPLDGLFELPMPKTLQAAASSISNASAINSSKSRGAELAKAKAGHPTKAMSAERYAAIMLYTGNSIYRRLNQVLREDWKAVKPFHPYLRLYFEAMSCLPSKKVTLWRGIAADLFSAYSEGSVQTWWSVSSCTSDKNVAEGFMQQLGGKATLLTLECKNAVDVSPLSFYPHEAESLLLPGTQLRVLSRKRVGNVAHIHVEEV